MQHMHGVYIFIMHILLLLWYYAELYIIIIFIFLFHTTVTDGSLYFFVIL